MSLIFFKWLSLIKKKSSKDNINIKYSKKTESTQKSFDKLGEDIDFEEINWCI